MRSFAAIMLVTGALFFSGAGVAAESDPTAYHKKVYGEVNTGLKTFQSVRKTVEIDGAPVEANLTAWFDGATLRKIEVHYPDDHGETIEEYYYDSDGLVFVYQVVVTSAVDGSNASRRDERYYFSDGRMVRWLDENKKMVSPSSREFSDKAAEILESSQMLAGKVKPKGKQAASPAVKSTDGVFAGLEQGDYTHLLLTVGGEERSFFVLQADAKVERLIDNPDKYVGKRIRVFWKKSVEDIPEAGGKMEIDSVVSVQLP